LAHSSMSRMTSPSCCCFCENSLGTNFATTLHVCKSSVKIECAEPVLIPTSSAISQMVKRRSSRIRECTFPMIFAFWLVDGLPERWSPSANVQPSLKRLNHSLCSTHCIITKSLMNLLDCFRFSNLQALAKFDAPRVQSLLGEMQCDEHVLQHLSH
jgi:hypothetical protein